MPGKDLEFHTEAGRIALNLIATLGDRHGNPLERLENSHDLARWFNDVASLRVAPLPTDQDLIETKRLRACLARLMDALYRGEEPEFDDIESINEFAAVSSQPMRLSKSGKELEYSIDPDTACVLGDIARDAMDLATGDGFTKLKLCAADDCSVYFVDHSRPGKRRWCSMSRCGNKAKKRRFTARQSK